MINQDQPPHGDIEAQSHQDSLALLAEVANYLHRLPVHPMNREWVQKIQEHLDNPRAKALKQRLVTLSEDQTWRARVNAGVAIEGVSRFTPIGAPVVIARLLYPNLRLESPAVKSYRLRGDDEMADKLVNAIGREVEAGILINLSPVVSTNW